MRISFQMPTEHGAWGILLVPYFCAAAIAGRWSLPLLLSGVCALSLFLLRGCLEGQVSRAGPQGSLEAQQNQTTEDSGKRLFAPAHLLLAVAAVGSGSVLLFFYRRDQLFWVGIAAAALYLFQRWMIQVHRQRATEKRGLAAELVGVVLLSLTAPAAWISIRGALDAAGVELWLLNLAFFVGGILYVKYRVRGLLAHRNFQGAGERLAFAWPVFLYYFLLVALLGGWMVLDLRSPASSSSALRHAALGLAFAPGILRANRLLFHLGQRFPIRRLGWSEIVHATLFATFLILAFRLYR